MMTLEEIIRTLKDDHLPDSHQVGRDECAHHAGRIVHQAMLDLMDNPATHCPWPLYRKMLAQKALTDLWSVGVPGGNDGDKALASDYVLALLGFSDEDMVL